jgi:hypothetical protein
MRRQLGPAAAPAIRAAHSIALVLGDLHRDHGQLLDLPAHRLAHRDTLLECESVTAPATLRPILDHPVHCPRRQQWPALALVTGLGALSATRRILSTLLRRAGGRIGARGNRRVARTAVQPTLELGDPLILARDPHSQRPNLGVHPQKHLNDRRTPSVIDRFRLNPLHTPRFDEPELCPPNPTERLPRTPISRAFLLRERRGVEPANGTPLIEIRL